VRRAGVARGSSPRSSDHGRIHLAGDYLGAVYTDPGLSSGLEAALAIRCALQAGLTLNA
jgi:hypothetical protein